MKGISAGFNSRTFLWNNTGSGNWYTAGNWSPQNFPSMGSTANFIDVIITSNANITLDQPACVYKIHYAMSANTKPVIISSNSGYSLYFKSVDGSGCSILMDSTAFISNVLTISAPVVLSENLSIENNTPCAISGIISGTGNLNKLGSSSLTLNSGNTFTGNTIISLGTLTNSAGNDGIYGYSGNTVMLSGGTLSITTTGYTTNRNYQLLTSSTISNAVTFTIPTVISGIGSISKSSTGTLILSGINTYTGTTGLNGGAGSVTVSSDANFGYSGNTVSGGGGSGGKLNVTSSFATSRIIGGNFSPNVSSGCTFTMNGALSVGTLNILGESGSTTIFTNTYSSTSAISVNGAGAFIFNGTMSSNANTNVIASILKGIGALKTVTVSSGAIVEPGNNGVGNLSVNNFVMNSGSTVQIRTSGSTASKLVVSANLTLNGTLNLPDSSLNVGNYDIISYGGTLTNSGFTVSINNTGRSIAISADTTNKVIKILAT